MKILASLLTVSGILAAADVAHAQSRWLGVKGGVTLASADIEDLSGTFDAGNRTGWGIGAFLSLGSGLLSFQPELNFVENGFDSQTPLGEAEVKLRYLLPAVLLRVGLPTPVVRPHLFGGVGVGIEAECKINEVDCEDTPFALETKSTDATGIFGADMDITIGAGTTLRGDLRYAIGFSDINKASDVWTEIKNRRVGGVGRTGIPFLSDRPTRRTYVFEAVDRQGQQSPKNQPTQGTGSSCDQDWRAADGRWS